MLDDPLVREVRRVRDELAGKLNYDVEAIIHDLMARQREISEGHMMVQNVSERVPTANKDE
jgi:hypothetical protein